jgi:hypothetical protein
MTTKTTAPKLATPREPLSDELRTAYQVHTLVQVLTQRLAATPGWTPVVQASVPPIYH